MDYRTFFLVAALHSYKCEGKMVDSTVKFANDMILKCICPKNGTISLITWSKEKGSGKDNIAVLQLSDNLHIESKYMNRVEIDKRTPNNMSLIFTNTTEADIGYYRCSFTLFPQGTWEKRIHVVQSGDFEPPVLPTFHVATKLRRSANFICPHNPEVVVNQMIWEKVQVDSVDLLVHCDESGTPIYGAEYEDRVEIDCASRANSTMTLGNVTISDSGIYRCRCIGANGENTTGWMKLENTGVWIINGTGHLHWYLQPTKHQGNLCAVGTGLTTTNCTILHCKTSIELGGNSSESISTIHLISEISDASLGADSCMMVFGKRRIHENWYFESSITRRPLDYVQPVVFIAGGAVAATLLIIILSFVVTFHQHRKRKRKQVVTMKQFHVAQKQNSNRYGRSGFSVRQNASGEEDAETFATMLEPVYVNCKDCSNKEHTGV